MKIEKITDAARWDAELRTLPHPHILQSWPWGTVKSRWGWTPQHWLWRDERGVTQAAAQILVRRGLWPLAYLPKGPLVDWQRRELVETVLGDLERMARRQHWLWVKIDPDLEVGSAAVAWMESRGWTPSSEQIQFRNTMILDLRPEAEELLRRMKPKWRYNIRLARRRGVSVRVASEAELPHLYALYAETAARDGFIIRTEAYYLDVWRTFMRAGYATPLVAIVEGERVAMLFLFHFGTRAWYLYGASSAQHRNRMPNHLLQWEAIILAKALGCTTYDLWGAPDHLDPSDPMWGVYRFKVGFGATFVEQIGAYDYIARPAIARLYTILRPHLIAWMHRRYHPPHPRQEAVVCAS